MALVPLLHDDKMYNIFFSRRSYFIIVKIKYVSRFYFSHLWKISLNRVITSTIRRVFQGELRERFNQARVCNSRNFRNYKSLVYIAGSRNN